MKKSLVFVCVLFIAGPYIAFAQTYYPYGGYGYATYGYGNYGGYGCANLSSNLSYGSRGSEVLTLQRFLVNQNYPGVGSWMVTGYFGRATEAAVRSFQAYRGLVQTGVVDWATRSAILQSCGGAYYDNQYGYSQYPYQPQYQYSYQTQYPYSQIYPYYLYGYAIPLRLNSLSSQSGMSGSTITLYGSGFDTTHNTVRFGTNAAYGAVSTNGTSMTVSIPNIPPAVYPIIVTNSRGTSNSLAFTVTGSPYWYYNYGYNYGYNYNYGCSSYPYLYNCY